MSIMLIAGGQGNYALPPKENLCPIFSLRLLAWGILFFCSELSLSAQEGNIQWTDLDSFRVGYRLSTDQDTLTANQDFSVKLYLETLGTQECLGGQFSLSWAEGVELASLNPNELASSSWLALATDLGCVFSKDETMRSLEWSVSRQDSSFRSGSGWIARLHFTAGNSAVLANQVVSSFGGGLIVEANIDMKRSYPKNPEPAFRLVPNPCTRSLCCNGEVAMGEDLFLYDLEGKLRLRTSPNENACFDLETLKPGLYLAKMKKEDGSLYFQRILKR